MCGTIARFYRDYTYSIVLYSKWCSGLFSARIATQLSISLAKTVDPGVRSRNILLITIF